MGSAGVTGFEPLDLLDGIRRAVVQLEAGRHEVENAYERIVTSTAIVQRRSCSPRSSK